VLVTLYLNNRSQRSISIMHRPFPVGVPSTHNFVFTRLSPFL